MPPRFHLIAEFLGTFCLVFVGTAAVVLHGVDPTSVSLVGIGLAFGLVVVAMVAAVGDISGAHLNPAVTLGLSVAGRFPWSSALPYVVVQCLGAIAASALIKAIYPVSETLGATLPSGTAGQSVAVEIVLTAILLFVILNVTQGAKEKGITAGLAIGGVIAFEVICGGPVSGASMNPARSLGPALISGHFESLWIYFVGPLLGALVGVGACHAIRPSAPKKKSK
jgi:aquaporin NIP